MCPHFRGPITGSTYTLVLQTHTQLVTYQSYSIDRNKEIKVGFHSRLEGRGVVQHLCKETCREISHKMYALKGIR